MNWIHLNSLEQLQEIKDKSIAKPQLIFKHSNRCSISAMALSRLERSEAPETVDFYLLDLIANRHISNNVAELFNVPHESPQILLILNGECTFDESHSNIHMDDIIEQSAVK